METASSPATTSSTRTSQVGVFSLNRPVRLSFKDFLLKPQISFCWTDSWDHMYTTRNISPTNNQANIVELHPACVYSIRMYSYNKIGRSLPSKELTISTEEARECSSAPLGVTPICFPLSALSLNTNSRTLTFSPQQHLMGLRWT